jgi:hypothetical protein
MANRQAEKTIFDMPALPMAANAQKLMLAGASLQVQAFKAMMRYQIEALSFLRHRYEQDVKLVEDLVKAKEVGDAVDACSDFMRRAVGEYGAEAEKFASIGSRIASETAEETRKQAEAIVEETHIRKAA